MSESETEIIDRIGTEIYTNGVSNEFLVQLIILGSEHLNMMSIPDYERKYNMTYRGVKLYRPTVKLFGKYWAIDND